ncbi:hypothetical protein CMUS01_05585 [Colletotrichum musicola]|uniref:Uncharacterized protein n=1 Tax=Colletotrichum musicola TaxID=2175873 RepID=A0A8H6KR54_9PEZI|nr:hypothetical protein CMUS01_05585 [Colletotrichum musicola]
MNQYQPYTGGPKDKIKDKYINSPICEVLRITNQPNGQETIDRIDLATGQMTPMWVLHDNPDDKTTTLTYADPRVQNPAGRVAGTVRLKSMSSKPQMTVRGNVLEPKMTSYAHGHKFLYNGLQYRWVQSTKTMDPNILYFKDKNDRLIARYKRKTGGTFSEERPTFEMFVPPQTVDMDMFITSGLAVAKFWPKYKKDAGAAKMAGNIVSVLAG